MFGSAVGALSFAVLGFQLFERAGAVGGALVGAVVGGFSGLDSAIPPPPRSPSDTSGPGMGPFRSAASYAFAALACVALGFYLSGTLTLECRRAADGVHCSRVTSGWFSNVETSRTDYGPIATAYEGGAGQIVLATPDEQRFVIDGFDAAAVGQLGAFVPASAPTLVIGSNSLELFPKILWVLAAAVGLLSAWCFRDGLVRLRAALAPR